MPTKAQREVGALLDRMEEVDGSHRAARAAGDPVGDGEEDGRDAVAAHDAARDDALHALVPALAAHHDHAAAVVARVDLGERLLGHGRLDLATLAVDGLEARGKLGRPGRVVRVEQVEGDLDPTHAARGVETRYERERQAVRRDLGEVDVGDGREGDDSGAVGLAQAGDAVRDQGTVLAREQHHVGDGAERRHVGVAAPQVGLAKAAAQLLHELEGDARARELAGRAGRVKLGVGHGHALRHEVGRLVVVGHHDVDALRGEPRDLLGRGDAVVDRDHEVGLAVLHDAGQRLAREAVPLAKAVRDVGEHARDAQLGEAAREQARRRHAVDVEVAEDGDVLVGADGPLDPVRRLAHARDDEGVLPVTLERGAQERPCRLDVRDAA